MFFLFRISINVLCETDYVDLSEDGNKIYSQYLI